MSVHLKSTGQEVIELPYTGEGKQPWPTQKRRIMRPFVGHEGSRSNERGELLVVHKDRLDYKS